MLSLQYHYPGTSPETCLFHLLFKPSDELKQLADKELVKLYGPQAPNADFKYIAAHLRLGGLPKEQQLKVDLAGARGLGQGDLHDFLVLLQQARKAADDVGVNITSVPILLLVDNHAVREFIQAQHLVSVPGRYYLSLVCSKRV